MSLPVFAVFPCFGCRNLFFSTCRQAMAEDAKELLSGLPAFAQAQLASGDARGRLIFCMASSSRTCAAGLRDFIDGLGKSIKKVMDERPPGSVIDREAVEEATRELQKEGKRPRLE